MTSEPYASLCAAVIEQAVDDLTDRRPSIRRAAADFVSGPAFAVWVDATGTDLTADECRIALRSRGVLLVEN